MTKLTFSVAATVTVELDDDVDVGASIIEHVEAIYESVSLDSNIDGDISVDEVEHTGTEEVDDEE